MGNQLIIANSTLVSVDGPPLGGAAELPRVGLGLAEQGWRPFAPTFEDDSSALARLTKLAALPEEARLRALDQELLRLRPASAPQHRYQAAALLLRDLTQMGWLVCVDQLRDAAKGSLPEAHLAQQGSFSDPSAESFG